MAARREVDIVLILHVMREAAEQRFHDLVSNYQMNGFGKLAVVVNSCGMLIGYCGIEMCEIDGKFCAGSISQMLLSFFRASHFQHEEGK